MNNICEHAEHVEINQTTTEKNKAKIEVKTTSNLQKCYGIQNQYTNPMVVSTLKVTTKQTLTFS